jgi:hypothetical protein
MPIKNYTLILEESQDSVRNSIITSKDVSEEIISKLEELNRQLDKLLEGGKHGKENS